MMVFGKQSRPCGETGVFWRASEAKGNDPARPETQVSEDRT